MSLVNRYLKTIAVLLPRARRATIEAELRDALLSRIEKQQAELGRALSSEELGVVIKEFGHPLIVAARYREHQPLIGTSLLPFYWFAIQVGFGVTLIAHVILSGLAIASGQDVIPVLAKTFASMCASGVELVGVLTLIGMFLERSGYSDGLAKLVANTVADWKPSRLPRVPTLPSRPSVRTLLALEFVGLSVLALLLFGAANSLTTMALPPYGRHIVPSARLFDLGRVALLVGVVQVVVHLVEILRPTTALMCTYLNVVVKASTLILVGVLLAAKPLVEITGLPAAVAQQTTRELNVAISIGLTVVAAITLVQIISHVLQAIHGEATIRRNEVATNAFRPA